MYSPGRPLGYFYFYFYWLFSFFSDFYKFIKMVFDVFPFGVIYLYLMEFPMHIWILLQIAVILMLHICHFDTVVWTHPHPLALAGAAKHLCKKLIADMDSPQKSGSFGIWHFPFEWHQISHRRLSKSIWPFVA
jgi:hypothetical protein